MTTGETSDAKTQFEFTVQRVKAREWRIPPQPAGWAVYLPHQCDTWDIAGDLEDPVSHGEAVAGLEAFVAEAQAALEALKRSEQWGDYDSLSWLDDVEDDG